MMNQNLPQASLVISMDHTMGFQHTYSGHNGLLIPMLGALRFAEDWVMKEIAKNSSIANPLCTQSNPISLEVEVPKDRAIEFYWEAINKIKDRMLAINKSDPQATFVINPSTLKSL